MARGKNSRSRANNGQAQQQASCRIKNPHCQCINCVTDRNLDGKNSTTPASIGHRHSQDVIDSIDYHWKVLSPQVKKFLTENPSQMHLQKYVEFWSDQQWIESAKGSCASSVSGSSWFLALNYLFLDKLVQAQALILNGAFMQECVYRPIEDIVAMCNAAKESNYNVVNQELRIYGDAFVSTRTKQSMEAFLAKALPADYRRRMNFACQAGKSHSIVGDYVNFISNDWNGASPASSAASRRQTKGVDCTSFEVVMINSDTNQQSKVSFGSSTLLKSVFNNYADEQGVSLRSLRFTYNGNLLFLSSAGNKTAEQLGIKHLDAIHIASTNLGSTTSSVEATKKIKSQKSSSKRTKKGKGKSKRKQPTTIPAETSTYEQDKIQHSNNLSRVFDEAQSILKAIRQRLNALNIERTQPKQKRPRSRKSKATVVPVFNPPSVGTTGKAGKTSFVVQVGESCNLYKTTKRPLQQRKPIVTDLHGMTKEEAISKLDSSLPQWTDTAMKGSYPFVVPVKIICGGGSQVLSEVVETWIKDNGNVSNAPKNLYAI